MIFNKICTLSADFRKSFHHHITTQIRRVGAEFINAETGIQTDMLTLLGTLRAYSNTPKSLNYK